MTEDDTKCPWCGFRGHDFEINEDHPTPACVDNWRQEAKLLKEQFDNLWEFVDHKPWCVSGISDRCNCGLEEIGTPDHQIHIPEVDDDMEEEYENTTKELATWLRDEAIDLFVEGESRQKMLEIARRLENTHKATAYNWFCEGVWALDENVDRA